MRTTVSERFLHGGRGQFGEHEAGAQIGAEQGYGADCLQRALRSRFRQQLIPSVRCQHLPGCIACCMLSHFEILLLHARYLS
jgi:hypothetical protein